MQITCNQGTRVLLDEVDIELAILQYVETKLPPSLRGSNPVKTEQLLNDERTELQAIELTYEATSQPEPRDD